MTTPALAEPFIAAGAAVAFWFFFATEKELSPRGYERNEIIYSWWKTPTLGNWIQIRRLLRRASSQWQKRCLIAITRKILHRYDNRSAIVWVALCHCERSAAILTINWIQIRRLLRRASSQWQKKYLIALTKKIPHRYDKKIPHRNDRKGA